MSFSECSFCRKSKSRSSQKNKSRKEADYDWDEDSEKDWENDYYRKEDSIVPVLSGNPLFQPVPYNNQNTKASGDIPGLLNYNVEAVGSSYYDSIIIEYFVTLTRNSRSIPDGSVTFTLPPLATDFYGSGENKITKKMDTYQLNGPNKTDRMKFIIYANGPPGTSYRSIFSINAPPTSTYVVVLFQTPASTAPRPQLIVSPLPLQNMTGVIRTGLDYALTLDRENSAENTVRITVKVNNSTSSTGSLAFTFSIPPFATNFVFDEHSSLSNNQLTLTIPLTANKQITDSFFFTAQGGIGHVYSFSGTAQEVSNTVGASFPFVLTGTPY